MCVEALIEIGAAEKNAEAKRVLDRGEAWLLEHLPKLRRADSIAIYNVWGHAYGIEALAAMYRRETNDEKRRQRIKDVILTQIDLLRRYESVDGGWGYYDFRIGAQRPATDSISFVGATVLIALHEARQIGVAVPDDMTKRAIAAINRQRKNDHSYLYGEYLKHRPMRPINRAGGSLGRSQACNLALRLWGDQTITDRVLIDWLDRLVKRNGWLSIGRKRPVPHEAWFQVAGYFFYYGHYYASMCIEQLDRKQAKPYREHLAGILVPLQEKDGSWWDYPLYDYHQPYGTAFALMSLARCREAARR
ncbi:MAG: terpene cyclase/mutase family protein [Verrucomicrobia bacterium]|nr:terpene cyclase/mutase family protein [Verrucomicrobiota bacterium]